MALPVDAWDGEAAFARLYAAYSPRVAGLARRLVYQRDLADDVVQDTFLRAYRSGLHYERERDPWPWLALVARNLCHDLHRRDAARPAVTLEAMAEPPAVEPTPEAVAERRAQAVLVGNALADLPEYHRDLLRDHHVDGVSCDALATRRRTTVEGVKSALRRARAEFRDRYDGWRGLWPEVLGPALGRLRLLARSGMSGIRVPAMGVRPGAAGALAALVALGMTVPNSDASEKAPGPRSLRPRVAQPATGGDTGSRTAPAVPDASTSITTGGTASPDMPVGGRLISFQPPESPDVPPTPAFPPSPSTSAPPPPALAGPELPALPSLPALPAPAASLPAPTAAVPGVDVPSDALTSLTAPLAELVGGVSVPLAI